MGNASSELQHIENALNGLGPVEKRFMEAVYENRIVEATDLLMSNPNIICAHTEEWLNAWHIVALSGSLEMLEVLHRLGTAQAEPPSGLARLGSGSLLKRLSSSKRHSLPGDTSPADQKSKKGITPLMVACQQGNAETMKFLMSVFGAEVRTMDNHGNTCVHYAALNGRTAILELLLATADAELEDKHAGSPTADTKGAVARGAAAFGVAAAAHLGADALAKGRFVDLRNEAGLQPLHFAVWGGHVEAAKVLITNRCDLDGRSTSDSAGEVACNGGSTPLHVAAGKNNMQMVRFLLEMHVKAVWSTPTGEAAPADPRTFKDNHGFTPYELASHFKRRDVLPLLDPRAMLPSIQSIMRTASMVRQQSVRRRTTDSEHGDYHLVEETAGALLEEEPLSPLPSPDATTSIITSQRWDPFVTGAFTKISRTLSGSMSALSPDMTKSGSPPADLAARLSPTSVTAAASTATLSPTQPAVGSFAERICPITNIVMGDPVIACDGRSYERSAVEMWFKIGMDEFPGGIKITNHDLTPNIQLKNRIDSWQRQQR